jgi:hypothetical protein
MKELICALEDLADKHVECMLSQTKQYSTRVPARKTLSVSSWSENSDTKVAETTMEDTSDHTLSCAAISATPYTNNDDYDSGQSQTSPALGYANSELETEPNYNGNMIEADLTIQVPLDVIEDDHALALVQVLPPDADLSDIPDNCDIYNIDFTGESPDDEEEWSETDRYWEEDPPDDNLDEPDGGSYY